MEVIYILVGLIVGSLIGWGIRSYVARNKEAEAFQLGMKAAAKIFQALIGEKEDSNEQQNA